MTASDLFNAGQLQPAIDAQTQEVRAHPGDPRRRLFLFELLAFTGDWDKARRQLEALQHEEVERDAAVQMYRNILDAEQKRRRLFHEGLVPQFFAEPAEHVRLRLEALNRLREGRPAEASDWVGRAKASAPSIKGQVNGKPFEGMADTDEVFGPVLEVFAHENYCWVPLEQVQSLVLEAPTVPRHLLWAPAQLVVREGPEGKVFLPVLYPGSHEHAEDLVKLGYKTEWLTTEEGPVRGMGQHVFQVGEEEISLLDLRQLQVG
jgi:type VI secretion system protein ImpE